MRAERALVREPVRLAVPDLALDPDVGEVCGEREALDLPALSLGAAVRDQPERDAAPP